MFLNPEAGRMTIEGQQTVLIDFILKWTSFYKKRFLGSTKGIHMISQFQSNLMSEIDYKPDEAYVSNKNSLI